MKKILILMVTALVAVAHAQPVNNQFFGLDPINLTNHALGNGGVDLLSGNQTAVPVLGNNIFHAPQYMPYHPTAATIYPRVIEVKCVENKVYRRAHGEPDGPAARIFTTCDGYNWAPSMGRAEYLFVTPKVEKEQVPKVPVENFIYVPGPERIILKEVPAKKLKG